MGFYDGKWEAGIFFGSIFDGIKFNLETKILIGFDDWILIDLIFNGHENQDWRILQK